MGILFQREKGKRMRTVKSRRNFASGEGPSGPAQGRKSHELLKEGKSSVPFLVGEENFHVKEKERLPH